jgi:hypothetical protein
MTKPALPVSPARRFDQTLLHPAQSFTPDGRPLFPAHLRHLPPAIIRTASFAIAIGGRIEDRRAAHETTVAACEGSACPIRAES